MPSGDTIRASPPASCRRTRPWRRQGTGGSRTAGRSSRRCPCTGRSRRGSRSRRRRTGRRRRTRRPGGSRPCAPVGIRPRHVAVLHPQQLVNALVELVVADAVVVEAHQVERLDGRLVVEQRRQQRRRADEVAGRDEDRLVGFSARRLSTCVARYSTPPAGMQVGVRRGARLRRPGTGPGASRCDRRNSRSGSTTSSWPWKSLRPRIWISTGLGGISAWLGRAPRARTRRDRGRGSPAGPGPGAMSEGESQ